MAYEILIQSVYKILMRYFVAKDVQGIYMYSTLKYRFLGWFDYVEIQKEAKIGTLS